MSAQPDHVHPTPQAASAFTAAAHLLAQIRAGRRADIWGPAFEQDWARALDDARHSYSLTPLHDVVRTWPARLAAAPAVDAFRASGMDDSDGVDLADALDGAHRR